MTRGDEDNAPADWRVWWRWSSRTDQWTRHERAGTHAPMRLTVPRLTAAELDHADALMAAWDAVRAART